MIQTLLTLGAFAALFTLFTMRLRVANGRAAFWKKVALGSAAVAAVAVFRKGAANA